MTRYILNANGEPELCPDLMEWARWFGTGNRQVANDEIGDVRVSTVFLGLDHSFGLGGGPILFETMVFGGEHDGEQDRYRTREEALAGHASMLEMVMGIADRVKP